MSPCRSPQQPPLHGPHMERSGSSNRLTRVCFPRGKKKESRSGLIVDYALKLSFIGERFTSSLDLALALFLRIVCFLVHHRFLRRSKHGDYCEASDRHEISESLPGFLPFPRLRSWPTSHTLLRLGRSGICIFSSVIDHSSNSFIACENCSILDSHATFSSTTPVHRARRSTKGNQPKNILP